MTVYAQHVSTRQTPQSEPVPGKPMTPNSAGGYAFAVDDWTRFDRFLILGNDGGTYYAGERKLTVENAVCVGRCLTADAGRAVARIVDVSTSGRAPKNDPAIFALALAAAHPNPDARKAALAALPRVCRTGTHLFQFNASVEHLRGRGRSLNAAVRNWYLSKAPDALAYQMAKYQQRDGWSHRDLLRLAKPHRPDLDPLFRWAVRAGSGAREVRRMRVVGGKPEPHRVAHYPAVEGSLPRIVEGFEKAKAATTAAEVAALIRDYGLVRECVSTQFLTDPAVWEALLEKMPMTAIIRNLATMTRVGLLAPMSAGAAKVTRELQDADRLRKSRVHPVAVLSALLTYKSGRGERGQNTWAPVSQVVDALDGAFYAAFGNVTPTGKRWLLACDVSGSMDSGTIAGVPGLTPRVGTAAMALVTAAVEPAHQFVAFTSNGAHARPSMHHGYPAGITPLSVSPRQRLDDVCRQMSALPMGRTDCALPMLYATEARLPVDAFVVLTDNETWAGNVHPFQALRQYRDKTGIPAKLIVVGMTATQFSIADPADGGMLDVVGFDTAAPNIMADFVTGGVSRPAAEEE